MNYNDYLPFFAFCVLFIAIVVISSYRRSLLSITDEKERDVNIEITKIAISSFGIFLSIIAGYFAYMKYDQYRKGTNYEKVVERYVDKGVGMAIKGLEEYRRDVSKNTISGQARDGFYPASGLVIFDAAVYSAYAELINQVDLDFNEEKNFKNLEKECNFVIFNLLDINELITREADIYRYPNLEELKQTNDYNEIIKRFRKFVEFRHRYLHHRKNKEDCSSRNADPKVCNFDYEDNLAKSKKRFIEFMDDYLNNTKFFYPKI